MATRTRGRTGGGSVDWLPSGAYLVAFNAVALNAQTTLLDQVIENVSNSQDYDSGAVVGLRAWLALYHGSAQLTPSEFVCMVLPSGMTVPPAITPANKKANEKFIWFQGFLEIPQGALTTGVQMKAVEIRSSRKFDQGDRVVIVLINRGVATAATGVGSALLDLYVREAD